MQCIQFYLSWKIQRYAIDLPFNVFTIQYMSIFYNPKNHPLYVSPS